MSLTEPFSDLVYGCLGDRAHSGADAGTASRDLLGRISQRLGQHGSDVGYWEGPRLTPPGNTPQPTGPTSRRLPLVLQENDEGHPRIYCDSRDCCWSWPLCPDATS